MNCSALRVESDGESMTTSRIVPLLPHHILVSRIARFHCFKYSEVIEQNRYGPISRVRQIAMYVLLTVSEKRTISQVARMMQRDRKTVYYNIRKIRRELMHDPELRDEVKYWLGVASRG